MRAGQKGETPPNEDLVPDSVPMKAERRLQHPFSFSVFFPMLILIAAVVWASRLIDAIPNRDELGPKTSALTIRRVALDRGGFGPLKLAGAWHLTSPDPRFGGFSGLAFDNGLIALTDRGAVARFHRSPAGWTVMMDDLPDGPDSGRFRANRDSEALLADPRGRGWWVSFEHANQLWLYDPDFDRPLERIRFGRYRWPANAGIEGLTAEGGGLLLFIEGGKKVFRSRGSRLDAEPVVGKQMRFSEATALPGKRFLAVERSLSLLGFRTRLALLEERDGRFEVIRTIPLGVGRLDNVEGMAIEARPDGGQRLWLMTDDNFQPALRTLLVALDVPKGTLTD